MNKKSTKKIPVVKPIDAKKQVEILREVIMKKDEEIQKLKTENALLLNLSIKNTKKRLEENELNKKSKD